MKRLFASVILSLTLLVGVAPLAQAQLKIDGGGNAFTNKAKTYFSSVYDTDKDNSLETTLPAAVGAIIGAILGLVGVILLVIMVYAGFLWLTAGGNDDQVAHAKQLIKNGVIGMAITLSAFVITQFVVNQITGALQKGAANTGSSSSSGTIPTQSPKVGGGGG